MTARTVGDATALMLYEPPEPGPSHFVTKRRPMLVSLEAIEQMEKAPGTIQTGSKSRPGPAQNKKERLAEALRRNLVKRKDKKDTNPESKSSAD